MKEKLRLWNAYPSWEEAEKAWDEGAEKQKKAHPLKQLTRLPQMPGMTKETASFLKWKSLKYLLRHDTERVIPRYFFKRPLKYSLSLLKSLFKKKSYLRDDDFFLYGIKNTQEFKKALEKPDSLLVLGFSYCHKPFECPSKRFTPDCIHDKEHPVCRQCFIGKAVNAAPEKATLPLFIPTIHYIGEKIFELVDTHRGRELLFIITACEMTLEMFGPLGNMVGIRGIGVRLDGRICNTMKAFELSEKGIKPGLTVVLDKTAERILELIRHRRHLEEK
jgi:hypothetical protein